MKNRSIRGRFQTVLDVMEIHGNALQLVTRGMTARSSVFLTRTGAHLLHEALGEFLDNTCKAMSPVESNHHVLCVKVKGHKGPHYDGFAYFSQGSEKRRKRR